MLSTSQLTTLGIGASYVTHQAAAVARRRRRA